MTTKAKTGCLDLSFTHDSQTVPEQKNTAKVLSKFWTPQQIRWVLGRWQFWTLHKHPQVFPIFRHI